MCQNANGVFPKVVEYKKLESLRDLKIAEMPIFFRICNILLSHVRAERLCHCQLQGNYHTRKLQLGFAVIVIMQSWININLKCFSD